jgi:glycosidase
MPELKSISDVDLSPIPGKTYFSTTREWREEFIYFLLVDRFHDDSIRNPVLGIQRTPGIQTPDDFYGGKIRGITRNLDYIAGLGCTAIWLTPVFENNARSYHGYDINNFLDVDPRFGTKQDLIDLVDAAHHYKRNGEPFPIRIILDVVINNSGDNWEYDGGPKSYSNGAQFSFGALRRGDRPVPKELQQAEYYHRRGSIQNYDASPENQLGDIVSLKDFANDDNPIGSTLINVLIKSYCHWIRETDVDGFRIDAVKHMGPLVCSIFCSCIREYAYSLGKRRFFLFGELATPSDPLIDQYIGPNTSIQDGNDTVFFGADSLLDFRLAEGGSGDVGLRDVIKGFAGPESLFNRLGAQRQRALNRGELGRYLVTFVDNHDSFWQPAGRFGNGAPDEQVIAAIGYLLCSLGTSCIYYGTEQGFQGSGGDNRMREAMFDVNTAGRNLLNTSCTIYREISKIAEVTRNTAQLRFGRMYFRQISGNGRDFGFPYGTNYTLAFSRVLYNEEVLVAYNVSNQNRSDSIVIDATMHRPGDALNFLYGKAGNVPVQRNLDGTTFVKVELGPRQFVILQ